MTTCATSPQSIYLLRQQLFPRLSKCAFAQTPIVYLRHLIGSEGVAADFHKVEYGASVYSCQY